MDGSFPSRQKMKKSQKSVGVTFCCRFRRLHNLLATLHAAKKFRSSGRASRHSSRMEASFCFMSSTETTRKCCSLDKLFARRQVVLGRLFGETILCGVREKFPKLGLGAAALVGNEALNIVRASKDDKDKDDAGFPLVPSERSGEVDLVCKADGTLSVRVGC